MAGTKVSLPPNYQALAEGLDKRRVLYHHLLAPYTSIKIGGPADLFFEAESLPDLLQAVRLARRLKVPFFILGGGTNLLVADTGFRGLVIHNKTNNIQTVKIKGTGKIEEVYLKVDSGVQVNRLVRYTLNEGLAGLEVFLGQPGTVGGAMWINAHNMRFGPKFFGDVVVTAEILKQNGEVVAVPAAYFQFGYDKSSLQQTREIVLTVTIKLQKEDKHKLWEIAQEVVAYRRDTQPLNFPSSGCVFRNISKQAAQQIQTPNRTTSTGFLIESVGLKGVQIGGAKFSEKHAAFIVNVAHAKAADVKALIDLAKNKVKSKYGIEIKEEIVLVGDFAA